jgi:hypothetical protein
LLLRDAGETVSRVHCGIAYESTTVVILALRYSCALLQHLRHVGSRRALLLTLGMVPALFRNAACYQWQAVSRQCSGITHGVTVALRYGPLTANFLEEYPSTSPDWHSLPHRCC